MLKRVRRRCGLWAMKALIPSLSSATLLTSLVGAAKKNGNMQADVMVRDFMRAGMFFGDALGHVAILKQTDPATALAAFEGPVLFLNGTLDHRDSEKRFPARPAPVPLAGDSGHTATIPRDYADTSSMSRIPWRDRSNSCWLTT
jgi:hypothetical protein